MIGGGIAGCAVAGGLKTLGIEAIILDAAAQEGAGPLEILLALLPRF